MLASPLPQMSFDPGMLHNNGHTAYANGTGPGIRETGVVEKLLTSYGFIQCSERQARLFFHCSQYNGNLQELKIGGAWPWTNYKYLTCRTDIIAKTKYFSYVTKLKMSPLSFELC